MATTKKKNEGLSGAAAAAARVALGDAGKVTSSATTSRKASTRTSSGSSGTNKNRNTALAGQSVRDGQYTVTYDDRGYITSKVKDGGASATSFVKTTNANNSPNHQLAYQAAQNGDWDAVGNYINQIGMAGGVNPDGTFDMGEANDYYRELVNEFNYNANDYYGKKYDAVYGAGAWDGGTGTGKPVFNDYSNALVQLYNAKNGIGATTPSGLDANTLASILSQNSYQTPTYSDAPTWNGSEWDNVLNALADQLLNMNYTDWTKGDQYQALADRYGQQGRMSMQDVLGQISSRTGGLASSWAQTAANQNFNSFMSQLEDAAMDMYNVERNDLYDRANMARQYAQDDYDRYVDDYNRWENDRNYRYQLNRDAIEDSRYDQEWQYQQDQLARQQAEDQAQTLAKYGDFSGYKALGYTDAQIALMEAAYQMQNTKKTGGGGGGGGGDDPVSQDYNGLFRAAYDSGNPKSFIANNFGDYGFDKPTGLYEEFTEAAKTPVKSGFEMNASNFNATMQSISAQLQAGKTDAATANIERVWTSLSGQQKRQLQNFLKNYGMEYQP